MSVTELLYLMISIKSFQKGEPVMFLCWENGIGFGWRFALFLECFSDTFLVGCLLLLMQTNSQSFWLFVLALLAIYQWLIGTGLASLAWPHLFIALSAHFCWPHLRWPHWLNRSLAHWLIGSSVPHFLIGSFAPFLAFFELFSSSLRTLGPQGYLTSSYLSWSLGSG